MGHCPLGSIVWPAVTHFGELHCVDLIMYDRANKENGLLPIDPRGCAPSLGVRSHSWEWNFSRAALSNAVATKHVSSTQ